jgi:hypothetical protein
MTRWVRDLDENGFAFATPKLTPSFVNEIEACLEMLPGVEGRRRGGHRGQVAVGSSTSNSPPTTFPIRSNGGGA